MKHASLENGPEGVALPSLEAKQWRLVLWVGGIPGVLLLLVLVKNGYSPYLVALAGVLLACLTGFCGQAISHHTSYPLRTFGNILEAMAAGDFSLRSMPRFHGSMGELTGRINQLGRHLAREARRTREQAVLLELITGHAEAAILVIGPAGEVSFTNPAAEALFNHLQRPVRGCPAADLGLMAPSQDNFTELQELPGAPGGGKFYVQWQRYFEDGKPCQLVFLSDIRHILQAEERLAWQNLLRVLGHEINNSLTPLASISETGLRLLEREPVSANTAAALREGLAVIGARAHALGRFIAGYQGLAKLPPPQKKPLNLSQLLGRLPLLFPNRPVVVKGEGVAWVHGDAGQFEQVFVNLLKNADEAMATSGDEIVVTWLRIGANVRISVLDSGKGIANPENVFVPFYSTKPAGSGIGLVLCRQIAFNHGGNIQLLNREPGPGAEARFFLPVLPGGERLGDRSDEVL